MGDWLELAALWAFIMFFVWAMIKFADKQDKDQARHEKEQLERKYLLKKIESLEKKDEEK